MRVFNNLVHTFRVAKANRAVLTAVFVVGLMLSGVGIYQFNQTAVDAASPCNSQNDIVPNGVGNYGDITRHYNGNTCGDLKAIYDHYWIKPYLAPGDRVVEGQSNNRGEVIAEGRVVATQAASIGRQSIHSSSRAISINGQRYYETTHVGGAAFANPGASLPTLVVLDAAGNFKNAIIKACGNPVYAKPVPPPKPPVKDIQVCELATKKIITIKEDQFNPQLHSKNLDDCKEVVPEYACTGLAVSKLTDNQYKFETAYTAKNAEFKSVSYAVTTPSGETSTIVGSPNMAEYAANAPGKYSVVATVTFAVQGKDMTATSEVCKSSFEIPTPPPSKIIVCDLNTKQVISIDEGQYNPQLHSKNLQDCDEKCPIPGKEHLPKNSPDCVTPPTPVELPKTGAGDLMSAGIGLAAMGVSAYYYAASRRLF